MDILFQIRVIKKIDFEYKFETQKNKIIYKGYTIIDNRITKHYENLGEIKKTNDCRFKWVRNKSNYPASNKWNGNNQQGVTKTIDEAKEKILEGWCH